MFAVDITTVAITADGCIYVCGKFDGQYVKTPRQVTAVNPRDLFRMGYRANTGGCVRLSEYSDTENKVFLLIILSSLVA